MSFKAVIFDLDGVLVHTDRFHYLAWEALCQRLKIPFDQTLNSKLLGISRMESLKIILQNASCSYCEQECERLAAEKNECYKRFIEKMTPKDVSPDVIYTLNTLKSKKIRLAVGSSSKNAKAILLRTELQGFFDAVADGECITHSKPNPEVFLNAAEMLGIKPCEAIVIEDAASGIEAARAGGFFSASIGAAAKAGLGNIRLHKLSDLLKEL